MNAGRLPRFTSNFPISMSLPPPWEPLVRRPAARPSHYRSSLNRRKGTMTGLGMYFKKAKPSVYRIA